MAARLGRGVISATQMSWNYFSPKRRGSFGVCVESKIELTETHLIVEEDLENETKEMIELSPANLLHYSSNSEKKHDDSLKKKSREIDIFFCNSFKKEQGENCDKLSVAYFLTLHAFPEKNALEREGGMHEKIHSKEIVSLRFFGWKV